MSDPRGVRDVDDATFSQVVIESTAPALVEFWNPQWGPCQMMGPVVAALAQSRRYAIRYLRLNIAENPVTVARYLSGDAPVLNLFVGGRLVASIDGIRPREFVEAQLDNVPGLRAGSGGSSEHVRGTRFINALAGQSTPPGSTGGTMNTAHSDASETGPSATTDTVAHSPTLLVEMGPLAQLRAGRLVLRLTQLVSGLLLYGLSLALMVRGAMGLAPWDVLHSGVIRYVPMTIGQAVVLFSFVVLLLWIPLRERPGIGTVANAVLVGLSTDAALAVLAEPDSLSARIAMVVVGVALSGLATAMYIGSQFGRGPRDGLMTGLARRTGLSLRLVRTAIEIAVVILGLLLGGAVGAGTVLYALSIGPLAQLMLPWCTVQVLPPLPLRNRETRARVRPRPRAKPARPLRCYRSRLEG